MIFKIKIEKKIWLLFLALLILFVGFGLTAEEQNEKNTATNYSLSSDYLGIFGEEVLVRRVIDGDTIEVEGGEKVRYLGIDTPETVDPRKKVECFGKEASSENKKLVEGKRVLLVKDVSETDRYGRLLRYIYLRLDNGEVLFVNDYLIRAGFAKSLTYPPDVRFTEKLMEAEKEAREENRGLWSRCRV